MQYGARGPIGIRVHAHVGMGHKPEIEPVHGQAMCMEMTALETKTKHNLVIRTLVQVNMIRIVLLPLHFAIHL